MTRFSGANEESNYKYSICVPNYNYAHFIDRTIQSVLDQDYRNLEICVSDNSSSDKSAEVVLGFKDPRVHLRINQWNVGFGPNLDKAAALATGDRMIMVSSDDLMSPGALTNYSRLLDGFRRQESAGVILASAREWIDAEDRSLGILAADPKIWQVGVVDQELSNIADAPVRVANPKALLKRSLQLMRTPVPFLTTCYSRHLYDRVEGYGGNRLISPDEWFAWKLLTVADKVVYIDKPLFKYRWHNANQTAQQAQSGALKHLVDQYINTFEVTDEMLRQASLTRDELIAGFIENDIALRNLERVGDGNRTLARRGLHFGIAAYPAQSRRNWKVWILRALLGLGPLGTLLARAGKDHALRAWRSSEGAASGPTLRAK